MTRGAVVGLGLFILAVSVFGLLMPHSELEIFINTKPDFNLLRTAGAVLLILYAAVVRLRLPVFRRTVQLASVIALVLGTIGLYAFYLLPLDIFILQAAGIFGLLATFDLMPVETPEWRRASLPEVSFKPLAALYLQFARGFYGLGLNMQLNMTALRSQYLQKPHKLRKV